MNTLRQLITILGLLLSGFAYAGSGITYHGRLLRSDSSAVEGQFVGFRFKILAGDSNACEMYQETQTKDMRNSKGAFAIVFGDGSVVGTYNVSSLSFFSELFENNRTFNFSAPAGCAASPYTPATREGRKILVEFRESPTDPWEALPIVNLGYVPFSYNSVIADKALQVGSHTTASLLRVENSGTPQSISALTPTQYTTLASILGGSYVSSVTATAGQTTVSTIANVATVGLADVSGLTAGTYGSATQVPVFTVDAKGRITSVTNTTITGGGGGGITALTGDVTASGSGSVAATIANSAVTTAKIADANVTNVKMATDSVATANIVDANVTLAKLAGDSVNSSKIVDGSITGSDISSTAALSIASVAATGNVGANTMSTGAIALYELPANGTNYLQLQAASNMAANYSLVFPATDGSANQVLKTDGSGNLGWSTVLTSSTGYVNGGNAFGANATVGLTDAFRLDFLTNNAARMSIDSSGNVGIGTTSPSTAFQLASGQMMLANGSAGAPGLVFSNSSSTGLYSPAANDLRMTVNGGDRIRLAGGVIYASPNLSVGSTSNVPTSSLGVTGNASIGSSYATTAAPANGMIIAGSVGIGTTSPTTKLEINGSVLVGDGGETCASGNFAGAIRYNGGNLQFCNGTSWSSLGIAGAGITALTGDVTASGSGSVAATIANDAVTFAKIQNITDNHLVGRSAGSNGDMQEISIGTGLSLAAGTLSATGSDTFAGLPCGNGYLPYRSAGAWTCIQAASANTASTLVQRDASGNFTAGAGTFNTSVVLTDGAAGGQLTLSAPVAFTSYSLKLPSADGSANQVLKTDGSGNLGWSTALTSSTGYANGGNAFGANATIGLTDAFRLDFLTSNTARMSIDSSGNVGIGTTTPAYRLEVSGASATTYQSSSVAVAAPSGLGVQLKYTGDTDNMAALTYWSSTNDSSAISSAYMGVISNTTNYNSPIVIGQRTGAAAYSERVRIDSSGNVGIGTTTPSSPLTVAGTIESTSGGVKFPDATTQATASVQMLTNCIAGSISASTTTYASFGGGGTSATEANRVLILPFAASISKFYMTTTGAQPGTGALVVTVRKNSADTAVTFTIASGGAAGTYSDTTNSVSFAAGDQLSVKFANAASGSTGNIGCYSIQMKPL